MKIKFINRKKLLLIISVFISITCFSQTSVILSPYAKLKPVSVNDIKFTTGFWANYQQELKTGAIESVWQGLNDTLNSAGFRNFFIVAGLQKGKSYPTNWSDGDCYKWIEAASYIYAETKDVSIKQRMDTIIKVIGMAQAPDGYLQTYVVINKEPRWQIKRNHEDYNLGHLFTAASTNYTLTGETAFLNIAKKAADNLYSTFINPPRKYMHFGWNPTHVMGLVELYRVTYDKRYLALADTLLSIRGRYPEDFVMRDPNAIGEWILRDGGDQNQDRVPLRKENIAVGHSDTGMYLYSGAADIYSETGDTSIINALERIWKDVVTHKMYITGGATAYYTGVSPRGDAVHEAFGKSYDLPNANAYNETCSNIANAMFNQRMLNITGDAKYADVMETVLYNSFLSSTSLDASRFFYCNTLRYDGNPNHLARKTDIPERWHIHDCYCCPPSVARTLAFMPGWAYSISANGVWVNLYGSNKLNENFGGKTPLQLEQTTLYPWDGNIKIKITQAPKMLLAINLRIPAWVNSEISKVKIIINGAQQNLSIKAGTYIALHQTWKAGDVIELILPMEVHLMQANPEVEQSRNQVAVQRGPVVYCIESADLPSDVDISQIALDHGAIYTATYEPDVLGGITSIRTEAIVNPLADFTNYLYAPLSSTSSQKKNIKLIPYYAWANRGFSTYMTVWIPLAR